MNARHENEEPGLVLHTGGVVGFMKALLVVGWVAFAIAGLTATERGGAQFSKAALIIVGASVVLWGVAALTNLRVSFYGGHILIRRGLWPMKSETAVGYEDIRRVRASDRRPQVTIDVTGRKRFKIANYYAFADRPLPEVEFKEGAFHEPIRRMRSITSFLAQRMATT